ncbi:unnamed protein product [Calypogeia fissa]
MWRLKQLIPKEQGGGLEGKTVDVGSLKLQVRSTIAQGGFSSVYLARDAATGRQYAVKHIICNDLESVDLVKSEVAVMKALRGHPNIVTLHSQVVYDMGRTKECFLVMDYCDKMLANVLENRGAGYFDEKQILLIFRDICNAVYAMHCQSPPIAHRDLKAENVLMGGDGTWKLCDFGSTSTNHKRFEKADEMGLEEDIIRKHTTPAYRAPEMWDLYQRELISEKVDIWALGCLLFKIAYLKSAFDGESKLQILNGNYRIPEAPRYSSTVTDLIKDMLSSSPDKRPDVMQVWRRINEALPSDARKHLPDTPPSTPAVRPHTETRSHGHSKASVVPSRSPPLPPTPKDSDRKATQNGTAGNSAGAFWATSYAQDAKQDSSGSQGVDSPRVRSSSPGSRSRREDPSHTERTSAAGNFQKKKSTTVTNLIKKVQGAGGWSRDEHDHNGYEMRYDSEDQKRADGVEVKGLAAVSSSPVSKGKPGPSNDPAYNEFVAHFDTETAATCSKNHELQVELDRVNKELQQALAEKAAVTSRYDKLTAFCQSQQREIQGLKNALNSSSNPRPSTKGGQSPSSVSSPQGQSQRQAHQGWQAFDQPKEKPTGSIWDLQEGLSPGSTSQRITVQETNTWQPFPDSSRPLGPVPDGRRRSLQHTRSSSMGGDNWAISQDLFSSSGGATQISTGFGNLSSFSGPSSSSTTSGTDSRVTRAALKSQPAGWAGF